ncbi:related to Acid phosphatase precursor [Melanopsichium pennsylvanicum]|uniref:Purple acid phosphatase n=2 Tax=Melanopsichium pennsylvanicum TaxID=63383 RepID=A0AAJ4XPE8_9BASI|nr:related to Acid phosphatase precursor [Melanopsichium pennsylvanicum 4]SNX85467.1 related to Acid phosphatase precursor [Melanopsichium pennsylvanicum]
MIDLTVAFVSVLMATASASAYEYPVIPADKTTPTQARLSFSALNAVSVAWNTYEKIAQPCVSYGTSPTTLDKKACSSTSNTYATSRTWFNNVVLPDLAPGTNYYYKIESTNSTTLSFKSARAPGDTSAFSVNAVVDMGVYGADGYTTTMKRDIPFIPPSLTHSTIDQLASSKDDYDMIVFPGDFAYADDWYLRPQNLLDGKDAYAAITELFFNQLSYVSSIKPLMVGPGNHEAACREVAYYQGACPQGQYNFTDFNARFGSNMPTTFPSSSSVAVAKANATAAQALALAPFWYSFEYGMVHFISLDTETDFPSAPDTSNLDAGPFGRANQQLDFLKADLASVDRTITPWIIATGHRPWYSTGGSDNICTECQTAFEDLFYQYGVDLFVAGHVHNLQRQHPTYKGTVDVAGLNNPKAPWYIVAGAAGNIEGLSSAGTIPAYNAFIDDSHNGYARLTFETKNKLRVDMIHSTDGSVLDSATLTKDHKDQFVRQTVPASVKKRNWLRSLFGAAFKRDI